MKPTPFRIVALAVLVFATWGMLYVLGTSQRDHLRARLGLHKTTTEKELKEFFVTRLLGATRARVYQVMRHHDRVRYLKVPSVSPSDSLLGEEFLFERTLTPDYSVIVLYHRGRVSTVEFSHDYIQGARVINEREMEAVLGPVSIPRGGAVASHPVGGAERLETGSPDPHP